MSPKKNARQRGFNINYALTAGIECAGKKSTCLGAPQRADDATSGGDFRQPIRFAFEITFPLFFDGTADESNAYTRIHLNNNVAGNTVNFYLLFKGAAHP